MFYEEESLKKLEEEYNKIPASYRGLLEYQFIVVSNPLAQEYLKHGFLRRIGILKRCIERIYEICPPENKDTLSLDGLLDLTISMQAFILNIFGVLDNLAWIWVHEKKLTDKKGRNLSRSKVGFSDKCSDVRGSFSTEFQNYLNSRSFKDWFSYLEGFRDALAHRIPLYIPPSTVTSEADAKKLAVLWNTFYLSSARDNLQEKNNAYKEIKDIEKFIPVMTHSYSEKSNLVPFHGQILNDWLTVEDISHRVMAELK